MIDEKELQNYIKDLGFGADILEASAGENAVEIQVSLMRMFNINFMRNSDP